MSFFGADFVKGDVLLCVLTAGQCINVALGSVGYLLIMTGNEKKVKDILLIIGLLNIVISIIAAKYFGAIGVAFATSASMVAWNFLCAIEIRKILGFWMFNPKFLLMKR
ncbi:MAG: polysaccharide biosynthesis C-terminal domain-containing protein [Cycloclasticus sp.]|uniref:polysaccharide biosynthesis C-terminal domain-containing protein n=1 Tax=Cycloclasticus sp. TaxID=2024830 RepID=UPI00257E2CC1|nr:polysaccharide biosynthesis C-terminal domain-containing protein [Cycloclasticus sp.]MBV1899518.1 polysaccharide biosynthesis C-terminal domain-containing protein [Cycloclasticus sp.]